MKEGECSLPPQQTPVKNHVAEESSSLNAPSPPHQESGPTEQTTNGTVNPLVATVDLQSAVQCLEPKNAMTTEEGSKGEFNDTQSPITDSDNLEVNLTPSNEESLSASTGEVNACICQPDEQLRLLSAEVKLQGGFAEGQQGPDWEALGTGALILILSPSDPDSSRIVLGSLPPDDRPGSDITVLYSITLGEVQLNSASDGVVYLQLAANAGHFLAFSFKDLTEARTFYEVLGGKNELEAGDDPGLSDQAYETEEGLDFVAVFAPSQSNLIQFIEHLRKQDDNLFHYYHVGLVNPKYECPSESVHLNARNLINALLRDSWLSSLWDIFDKALQVNDETTLAYISELLVRIINVSCRVTASQAVTVDHVKSLLQLFYVLEDIDYPNEASPAGTDDTNGSGTVQSESGAVNTKPALDASIGDRVQHELGPPLNLQESLRKGEWGSFRDHAEQLSVPSHLASFLDPLCILMSDQHFERFLKAMERLPNLTTQHLVIPHVDFWKKQVCFRGKDILLSCVASAETQRLFAATMSWVSRLTYTRDVCIPRCLDDPAVNKLTVLIGCGNILLCRMLTQDKTFFTRVQRALPQSARVALFLVQILRGIRSSTTIVGEKQSFLQAIAQANVLGALEGYFTGDCPAVKEWESIKSSLMADRQRRSSSSKCHLFETSNHYEVLSPLTLATEIMTICALFYPRHIQHAILQSSYQNHSHPKLWLAMTEVLRNSSDQAVLLQIAEIFKSILHPNVFINSMEKEDFLGLFFDKGVLPNLVDILVEKCDLHQDESEVSARLFAKSQIVSIFCLCTQLHQSRIRYRFMQCNLPIKLVNLAVSLYKSASRHPLGHGVKSLLLQTIKFIKIFSVEQESGTGKDAVAALLPLLLPIDTQELANMGSASSDESGDEGFSIRSNDSSHGMEGVAWDSDDMSQERGPTSLPARLNSKRKSVLSGSGSAESLPSRPPSNMERRHFQGTAIEAALLDLFSSVLKRAQEKKLTHHIRHLVERNAATFRTLSQLYVDQCGITIFSDILQIASVAMLSLPSPTLTAPLKHSTSQRVDLGQAGGSKTLPTHMGGVRGGLLKRGRVCKGATSPSQSPADASSDESAQKKSRLSGPMDFSATSLNKIQSSFAAAQTAEFKLPSVAKSKESQETEDALEVLLKRGASPAQSPATAVSGDHHTPKSTHIGSIGGGGGGSSPSSSSSIQICFSQHHESLDNRTPSKA